jgi:hypothetical protein
MMETRELDLKDGMRERIEDPMLGLERWQCPERESDPSSKREIQSAHHERGDWNDRSS